MGNDTDPAIRGPKFGSHPWHLDFLGGSMVENPPANATDTGLIPGSRRSPGRGNGNPLQYSCLGNPMDRTEEPGGLQSMVLQKSHNLATKQQ